MRYYRFLLAAGLACGPQPCLAQIGTGNSGPPTAQAQPAPTIPNLNQAQLQGSVPAGAPSSQPLRLSLEEAIARGLRSNLGILTRETGSDTARATRLKALSGLLPSVSGSISENVQQTNLQALGIKIPFASKIVGPFGYTDVRASASATIWDTTARRNLRTAAEGLAAAALSRSDADALVVQAVTNAYFTVVADGAQIRATSAQIEVAKALYQQALDQRGAGTATGLDATRAQVQLRSQQQQLLAQTDQFEKDKLSLARIIGVPLGQAIEVSDAAPDAVAVLPSLDSLLGDALAQRADIKSNEALARSARSALEAAKAERYPTLSVSGNYGVIGPNLSNSHGTFTFSGALKFNMFDGGRIRSDVEQAQAALTQRQNELADLRAQVEFQVRTSLLDLKSTQEQVEVAKSNVDLANQSLAQSRERFLAGVTTTVEVVQAQQQVASAEQALIGALYAENLAKASLARAIGGSPATLQKLLNGQPLMEGEKR